MTSTGAERGSSAAAQILVRARRGVPRYKSYSGTAEFRITHYPGGVRVRAGGFVRARRFGGHEGAVSLPRAPRGDTNAVKHRNDRSAHLWHDVDVTSAPCFVSSS